MNTPDIEIYVKNATSEVILSWLQSAFKSVEIKISDEILSNGKTVCGRLTTQDDAKLNVVITPKAAGKAFTSIWFQSDKTGWKNDEECGLSLAEQFDIEIRCSASGWQEAEEENSEQWWLITQEGKKLIRW